MGGHGAGAEVVAVGKAAGEDYDRSDWGTSVSACQTRRAGLPETDESAIGHIVFAIGAGEDDDRGFHGVTPRFV